MLQKGLVIQLAQVLAMERGPQPAPGRRQALDGELDAIVLQASEAVVMQKKGVRAHVGPGHEAVEG